MWYPCLLVNSSGTRWHASSIRNAGPDSYFSRRIRISCKCCNLCFASFVWVKNVKDNVPHIFLSFQLVSRWYQCCYHSSFFAMSLLSILIFNCNYDTTTSMYIYIHISVFHLRIYYIPVFFSAFFSNSFMTKFITISSFKESEHIPCL